MKRFTLFIIIVTSLFTTNCNEREIDFIPNTQFLFSATLSDDFLIKDQTYELSVDIRLKDGVLDNLSFSLDLEVNKGTGTLFQNGFLFTSGGIINLDDSWTYKPTSLGAQSIVLTLSDNTGAQESVTIEVTVGEFIPVDFSFNANFTETETFIQTDTEFLIELSSDDPEMEYVLNYQVTEGSGEVRNSQGVIIGPDYPITTGTTKWTYHASGANNNQIKLKIKDQNGDELTKNISIFVIDKIPFTVNATVDPSTIRQSKSSQLSISISSEHPLFETLNFTMEYNTNFVSDAQLLDSRGKTLASNTPITINRDENTFTYEPIVPGTHNITVTVSDQKGNSESTMVAVSSQVLQKPLLQATAEFILGEETCVPQGFGGLEDCTAPLNLVVDLSGSVDQDSDLGGYITEYRITIDGIEYSGDYDPSDPVVSIENGEANYTKSINGPGAKTYSGVKHQPNAFIRVELKDDDGLWSEMLNLNTPENFPL